MLTLNIRIKEEIKDTNIWTFTFVMALIHLLFHFVWPLKDHKGLKSQGQLKKIVMITNGTANFLTCQNGRKSIQCGAPCKD